MIVFTVRKYGDKIGWVFSQKERGTPVCRVPCGGVDRTD